MRKYLFLVLFLFGISFVFAECCFDLSNGLCTENADSSSCSSQLFSGSCSGVSDCASGCCALGNGREFTTERECQVLANAGGFDLTWQQSSAAQCHAQQNALITGACVVQSRYENSCSIKSKSQCSGNFYEGQFCTNLAFNTTCVPTQNSKCVDGSAYYFDSCGNQERPKETCDYEAGTICRQNNQTREAYCKSLNCDNGYENGQSWCVFPSGEKGNGEGCVMANTDGIKCFTHLGGVESNVFSPVGSRYSREYCLNGEIVTEPCADYRQEYCLPASGENGEAKCEQNIQDECLQANTVEGGNSEETVTSITQVERKIEKIKDSCDTDNCYMFRALDCVSVGEEGTASKDYCGAERNDYKNDVNAGSAKEITSDMMAALGLEMCLPKIAGGLGISSSAKTEESICSLGNFEGEVVFRHDSVSEWGNNAEKWGIDAYGGSSGVDSITMKLLSYEALTTGKKGSYYSWQQIFACSSGNDYCDKVDSDATTLSVNPMVLSLLNKRCEAIADCAGKVNWVGKPGATVPSGSELLLTKNEGWKKTYTLTYVCSSWKAPAGGNDCGKCGTNGTICSEYSCKSLGKKCEYFEPAGVDRGYCVSSSDSSPPTISYTQNPVSPIPPFSPVTFTINTNEDSSCRFNLGSAGSKFESMQYAVDSEFGKTHTVSLTLPGVRTIEDSEASTYQLISAGGNYSMYVRCEDAGGNWNLNSYLIKFNVMQAPDKVPPVISQYTPLSNAAILFNTTNKSISFRLNEPSECKWSLSDKNFTSMENNFNCDSEVTDYAVLHGYYCNGVLTNVTKNLTQSTNYFIRCKDQPWLEGKEDNLYSRNTNPTSFTYSLRPSQLFEITSLQPSGEVTVSNSVTNITLSATTRGGGYNGVANCSYRLHWNNTRTGFYQFRNTNSVTHTSTLTNKTEGDYIVETRCVDLANNEQIKNSTIYFRYDTATPWIVRVYNDKGNIRFNTNENAVCKFVKSSVSNLACLNAFQQQNSTIMTGANAKQHMTSWIKGISYYVKCKDYYNNEDSGCFIARAEK